MDRPETRYAKLGDAHIAYQVAGDGPIDLVYSQGMGSCIEAYWEFPPVARVFERLASFSRLILYDRRGTGASDPVPPEVLGTWEFHADDLRAVLDAAGSDQAAIMASFDAGSAALVFAASNPDRTRALILWNSWARSVTGDDFPIGTSWEAFSGINEAAAQLWGTEDMARLTMPSWKDNPAALRFSAWSQRISSSPGLVAEQLNATRTLDARHALPLIRVPTLVLHRENPFLASAIYAELSRYVAEKIEGARFVLLEGTDAMFYGARSSEVTDLIEEFLTGTRITPKASRVLATVLFTDIVGSTERAFELGDARWREVLDTHDSLARSTVEDSSGRFIGSTGDGLLATFDLPGRAVNCAFELKRSLEALGIAIRAGVHTGELELRDEGQVGGVAVHIGARVMAEADGDQVICTRTVKDLTAGSGFSFEEIGTRSLKGVPDEWQLFAVQTT